MFPNIKIVEAIRKEYPAGTRIRLVKMKSFNVIVTVSTTIYVDANTPEDAIKKVQKALDANDAGTAMQLGENLSCALRDGGYQVTNAVEVDE